MSDQLVIADKIFKSRLILGTGKFPNISSLVASIHSSETEMVTVALRRVDLNNPKDDILSSLIGLNILLLPNTSGARNSVEAIRLARLARTALGHGWVKLEVTPEPHYLLPDPIETFEAAKILCQEGFTVLPYMNADPILAKRLADIGCAAVMPLGSPIGTNKGIRTEDQIRIIIEQSSIPVIVDAGLGAPSDACLAMELGAAAVLVNTAISIATEPAKMAKAFLWGVTAGREGYLSGLGPQGLRANASSPLTGFLES